jgi:hypothetical protein
MGSTVAWANGLHVRNVTRLDSAAGRRQRQLFINFQKNYAIGKTKLL